MTEILYNFDSYLCDFEAEVLSCTETEYEKKAAYDVVLDRTAFFPEQGGQDSDNGIIMKADNFDVSNLAAYCTDSALFNILHVSIKEGIIHHYCTCSFEPSEKIHGCIDKISRFDRMQQHSGEHLFSGTVHRLFSFDNVGFHLSDRECTLDFNGTFTDEELDRIEDIVNKAVYENIPVKVSIPSKAELAEIPYRSKKELSGDVRIVEFPGYDICACCAPHVAYTGEIGIIKIAAYEHFRGGTRIWIKCGSRALADYRKRLNDCRAISRITSAKIDEVSDGVNKLNETCKKARFDLIGLEKKLLQILTEKALSNVNPVIFIDSASSDNAREAVNSMTAGSEGYCCIFIGNDEEGYRFIIGAASKDCRSLTAEMKNSFEIRGGGTPDMVQGTVKASRTAIEEFLIKG